MCESGRWRDFTTVTDECRGYEVQLNMGTGARRYRRRSQPVRPEDGVAVGPWHEGMPPAPTPPEPEPG